MYELDILNKIEELRKMRGWSKYQLAKYAGVTGSTLSNALKRKTIPSIPILKAYLDAFDISFSQFFEEEGKDKVTLNQDELQLIKNYRCLDKEIKKDIVEWSETLKYYQKI